MSGEPEVCVKNTFLDIKTPAPELRRVSTEPGRAPPEEVEDGGDGDGSAAAAAADRPIAEAAEESPESDHPAPEESMCKTGSEQSDAASTLSTLPELLDPACFGRKVVVKNTFLDLDDDSPAPPILRRVKTEPLPRVDLDLASSQGDETESVEMPDDGEGENYRFMQCESVESSDEWSWGNHVKPVTPNAPRHLVAIREDDGETPVAAVASAASAAAEPEVAVPAPTPAAAPAPAPVMAPVPMPQGVMMVPSGMLVPGVVGMGTIENLPPGCVAVPVDRYARWPGGAPGAMPGGAPAAMPPGPPVAPPSQAAPVLSRVKSPDQPPAGLPSAEPELAPAVPAMPSAPPKPQVEQAPVLQRAFSVASAIFRVNWTVAARKLKSKDQFAVSPKFELSFKTPCEFKMVIHPTKTSDMKGGKSFVNAKGKGRVELKCETQLDATAEAVMTYRISVGAGDKRLDPRGPVTHNFAETSVSGLAPEEEEWDFSAVLEEGAQTFVVCLEVMPPRTAS